MTAELFTDMTCVSHRLQDLRERLSLVKSCDQRGLIGFDGFIDRIVRLNNPATMADFGKEVSAAAGIATSADVTVQEERHGGNGPLMTTGLSSLFSGQIQLNYIGALGTPEIHPLFQKALGHRAELHSIAPPATTDCLEFKDGKVMLSDMGNNDVLTLDHLQDVMGKELETLLKKCDFIAAVNWGKVFDATNIWGEIAQRWSALQAGNNKTFYMDLAEFSPRPQSEKDKLPALFHQVQSCCYGILSMNLKEAWQLAELYGMDFHGQKDPEKVVECAMSLKQHTKLSEIIVHPNDGAVLCKDTETVYAQGPFCSDPLISTGAGDHFGAGAFAAHLLQLDAFDSMVLGGCTSGYYVRTGISPSLAQICEFLDLWISGQLKDRL